MPGWYIHMDVARKAIERLDTNATAKQVFGSDGPDAPTLQAIAKANPTYVALGAIGPDIFFLLPDFKPPVGSMLWKLATFIRDVFTWWDDNFLGPYESAIGPITGNLDDELNALTGGLKETVEGIFGQAFSFLKDKILDLILQQYDFFGLLSSGVPAGFDEQTFFWSDMLHYRETYRFAAVLWRRANDPSIVPDGTDRARFQAFAMGWMAHLATDVTGHAFVNQKAGGPYRLHWQRHHLVENHMDAQVYNADHGAQPIYQEMSNAALHLWLAFNPDGTSRVNCFDSEPNPPYPDGDHSADITGRHAVWDVDSDMPDELAQFIADGLKAVYWPEKTNPPAPFVPQGSNIPLNQSATGPMACCPTIISSLTGRVPVETNGFADADDITGAYWWLYKYVKWTTTDYYKIRRPEPPEVFVIPSFPSPPGSGDSDPGPGASDDSSTWDDFLSFLLSLFAWAAYLAEIAVWPAAVIAGIVAGTLTYPLRDVLYEYMELPLYNLWLGVHTYMAMTGYVMPMAGELSSGLNTLGVSVSDGWANTVLQLGDPDGGLTPAIISSDPSGTGKASFPKDVLLDPANFISSIFGELFQAGAPAVNGEFPSEFTRPWRWPEKDNQGNVVNVEHPASVAGSFVAHNDATSLFGSSPGSKDARDQFERARTEAETIRAAFSLLPQGKHLGDPQDYTAYVIAQLTRESTKLEDITNFNLDADRGYGYLAWDWVRRPDQKSTVPDLPNDYQSPAKPGYGWTPDAAQGQVSFNPSDPEASVRIRYVDREGKFS